MGLRLDDGNVDDGDGCDGAYEGEAASAASSEQLPCPLMPAYCLQQKALIAASRFAVEVQKGRLSFGTSAVYSSVSLATQPIDSSVSFGAKYVDSSVSFGRSGV